MTRYDKPKGGTTPYRAAGKPAVKAGGKPPAKRSKPPVWRTDPREVVEAPRAAPSQFKKSNAKPRSDKAVARKAYDPLADAPQPREDAPGRQRGLTPRAVRPPRVPANIALLYGYHAVREALRSDRRELVRLYATAAAAERLTEEIAARDVAVEVAEPEDIARRLSPDAVHQGLLLEARHLEPISIADIPDNALVLVLDQISDPHNVGAIVRTAAAYGVDAIVTTERHAPELTGVLAKSASGGLEHVAIASIVNLARGLEELGDRGFLRVGLDSEGPQSLGDVEVRRPLALVLGAEGKGLRRLSRENCDVLARLDMPGTIKSLNVSNACAVALTLVAMKLG